MKRSGRLRKRRLRTRADGPSDKDLDAACRAVVFERDGHKCVRCGSRANLQWSHVYSRRYKSIRWNLRNSKVLCAGCHLWWGHNPLDAASWWNEVYGESARAYLNHTRQSTPKIDRKLTLIFLNQELKRLRGL